MPVFPSLEIYNALQERGVDHVIRDIHQRDRGGAGETVAEQIAMAPDVKEAGGGDRQAL